MKRTLILCILFSSITAFSFSQKISLSLGKVALSEALKEISNEANVDFFYSDKELNADRVVMANYENTEVLKILSDLVGTNYNIKVTDENIILITPRVINNFQDEITIKGVITDNNGELLPGVSIVIKDSKFGTTTDLDGNYTITTSPDAVLVVSYIGYVKQEIAVDYRSNIDIELTLDIKELEEVVVTGIVTRKKESFTGAVTSVTQKELQEVSNINVVQSLKTIDPAFAVFENNDFGGNPNVLPHIEVRGKTSVTTDGLNDEFGGNPNQPLFILDGFETTLRTITDLDMNRVASITILKDASSTALYGAKAANGVVVVETIQPIAGKIRVTYNLDVSFDIPDLTDYELMNSSQKLEYELLSERWTHTNNHFSPQFSLDKEYNAILAELKRGVDTYWLDEPTQTGTTIKNSLYVSGGSEALSFGVGVNYRNIEGVMIGSGRKTWGTNIDLTYRKNKWNISNRLYLDGVDAENSPYGSFSNFAKANPYFRKTDEEGNITKFLDIDNIFGNSYANPLYNAQLNSYDTSKQFNLTNNFQAIYTINQQVRLHGNLQLKSGSRTTEIFKDPDHTSFSGTPFEEKGSYNNVNTESFSYKFNVMATYANVFKEKHQLTANLRAEAEETNFDRLGVEAVGYPAGTNGNPAFAFSYKPASNPTTAQSTYRRVNVLASVNYAFDNTFLVDGTYRLDGSTVFGSNERFSPFWSFGVGWNMHNTFKMNPDVVSMLKLRADTGLTGNQGFGSLSSVSIYGFTASSNIFGQSTDLETLANPDLEWQNTLQRSYGIDAVLFKNRLSATFNYYTKQTDPLIVRIDLPSSTGVYGYPINAGYMDTKGFETYLRVSPIYKPQDGKIWTLGVRSSRTTSEYGGFDNILNSLNENAQASTSLLRFRDGYSPDDLWAVPSLGIDPSNGQEVYLTKEGVPTYEYNQEDEVAVGNARPTLESVFSSDLRIKNFNFGFNIRYRYGGEKQNTALFNKVENISLTDRISNQDLRALTDRWINPGDVTPYKSITNFDSTPMSSRFIQEENVLIGESISFGYEFRDQQWVDKLKLNRLRLSLYMNDIFRISSIKTERGIEYPFARTVSFSLNAYF